MNVSLRVPSSSGSADDGRRVQDERLDLHLLVLLGRRVDEERLREQRVPRALGDDPHGDAVRRVGAREGVDHVDVVLAEGLGDLVAEPLERLLGDSAFVSPHQIRSSDPGSRTMYLSFGERPVCTPVSTTSGPPSASDPSPRASACVYSCEVDGCQ